MSERLVVRLGSDPQQSISWVTWSESSHSIISSGVLSNAAALATLTERASGRPVDVLVDSSAILLTQLALPAKAQRHALKALPFMLEEQLAEEVEGLHFVVGPRHGEHVSVAVVSHQQMTQWQQWLESAQLAYRKLVPDVLALPLIDGCALSVLQLEQQLLVRHSPEIGEVVDRDWLPLLSSADEPQSWALFSPLTDLPETVEPLVQPLELPMLLLAQGVAQAPLNLLSGVYAPVKNRHTGVALWSKVGIAAAVLFTLAAGHNALVTHQLTQQQQALKAEQERIYRSLFPNETRVVNARSQLQAKVRAVGGSQDGELMAMLALLQPTFAELPDVKPSNLRFDAGRGELRMQLMGKSFAQIERFGESAQQHFVVQSGALNNEKSGVSGTLTIRGKG